MQPRKTYEFTANGKEVSVSVLTVSIGNLSFVGCRPEVNAVTERELVEVSPAKHTCLISMVNGGMKYMPDRASYERISWEAQSSMMMPGAAETFVATAVELLR